jgi:hypothetical protein
LAAVDAYDAAIETRALRPTLFGTRRTPPMTRPSKRARAAAWLRGPAFRPELLSDGVAHPDGKRGEERPTPSPCAASLDGGAERQQQFNERHLKSRVSRMAARYEQSHGGAFDAIHVGRGVGLGAGLKQKPDVMRQVAMRIDPGTRAITAGTMTATYRHRRRFGPRGRALQDPRKMVFAQGRAYS